MTRTPLDATQWTPQDFADLELCAEIGDSVQTAAAFLGCTEEEVRSIAKSRGLELKEGLDPSLTMPADPDRGPPS